MIELGVFVYMMVGAYIVLSALGDSEGKEFIEKCRLVYSDKAVALSLTFSLLFFMIAWLPIFIYCLITGNNEND